MTPRQRFAAAGATLCKVAVVGLTSPPGNNIVPPGSMYPATGIPVFNLTVLPNTVYQITWGGNDQSMTMGNETYVSGGSGTVIIVYTNGNTNMAFIGTANGTTVTVVVQPAPKAVPIPGDFTFTANAAYTNVIAAWDTPPANVVYTEVWTSADNITFVLAQTIAAPGNTATIAMPAVGSTTYCKIRWKIITLGAFTGVLQYLNTDWSTRVVANAGNAVPAQVKAVNDFYNGIVADGLLSDMICINCMAYGGGGAGSAATLLTPLIKGPGSDPWVSASLLNTDTTVNGCVGRGAFFLQTGIIPSTAFASVNNAGVSCYSFTSVEDGTNYTWGSFNGADAIHSLHVKDLGNTLYDCFSLANRVTVASPGSGFYSQNRVSATDLRLFFGNSTNPTAQVGATSALGPVARPAFEIYVMALNNAGANALRSNQTVSFWAATNGLTLLKADLLKKRVQTMRVAMGGGSV